MTNPTGDTPPGGILKPGNMEPFKEEPIGGPAPPVEPQGQTGEPSSGPTAGADPYAGKSDEELRAILRDKESFIGRQTTEIGSLRDRVDYFERLDDIRRQQEEIQRTQGRQQPQPGQPGTTQAPEVPAVNWDYDKPVESTTEIVRKEMHAERMRMGQLAMQSNVNAAAQAFEEGRQAMRNSGDKLYEGIEKDVEAEVYNHYLPWLQQGHDVSQWMRPGSEAWVRAAQNIRLGRGEYDRLKPDMPITTHPVQAGQTEVPSPPARPEAPSAELTSEEKQMAKQFGWTDEQAKEIREKERALHGGAR